MPFDLDSDLWTSVLRATARGDYNLLLGAGASVEAKNRYGAKLPAAPTLAQQLVADFGVPARGEIPLSRAYESANRGKTDARGRTLFEYLQDAFTDCVPPAWYEYVCSNRWSRIWTLNIDDVVEGAYSKWSNGRLQNPISLAWSDRFREPNQTQNEVIVVHLHGNLPRRKSPFRSDTDPNLVFDIVQYRHAGGGQHAWHHIFGDEFSLQPFVVIGARLIDEYDLAATLRQGNHSLELTGVPSLVVLREFDDLQLEEFQDWGLTPIRASAEEFFTVLAKDVKPYLNAATTTASGTLIAPTTESRRFLSQFDPLRPDPSLYTNPPQDFYAGYDPTWKDVLTGKDAERDVVRRVTDHIAENSGEQLVYCLWGTSFSGKSTAALRIARQLIVSGYDVFRFRAETRLDRDAVAWWAQQSDNLAILVDGLADHGPEIGKLCVECKKRNARIVVIGTERDTRKNNLYGPIDAEFLVMSGLTHLGSLSDGEIHRIIVKLEQSGRLGKITSFSDEDRMNYFRYTSRRQLFSALTNLEGGRGFLRRLRDQYEELPNAAIKDAYVLSCMSYAYGHPLPFAVLCDAADVPTDDMVHELGSTGNLRDILEMSGRTGVKPRHRAIASTVVERIATREDRYRLTLSLARALAPYITPMTISLRTIPHRITRELMDQKLLAGWIGRSHVTTWFDELADQFGWNSRFWEQRALAEAAIEQYDKAESYAEAAVDRQRDQFTLNTLGTILLRKAVEWFPPRSEESTSYYWRGVRSLWSSLNEGDRPSPYPYITFFSYTQRFVDRSYPEQHIDESIESEWKRWWSRVRYDPIYDYQEVHSQLHDFLTEWLVRTRTTRAR